MIFFHAPHGACPFFAFYNFLLIVTSWADVALAINRVVAVSLPHHYDSIASIRVTSIMTFIVWVIGSIVVSLMLLGKGLHYQQITPGSCLNIVTSGLGVFLTMAMNTIPVIIAGICSLVILGGVGCYRCTAGTDRDQLRPAVLRQRNTLKKRMVLAKAMMASFVWCFCCTMPLVISLNFLQKMIKLHPSWVEAVRILAATEYAGKQLTS